jgi:hypothetical protein
MDTSDAIAIGALMVGGYLVLRAQPGVPWGPATWAPTPEMSSSWYGTPISAAPDPWSERVPPGPFGYASSPWSERVPASLSGAAFAGRTAVATAGVLTPVGLGAAGLSGAALGAATAGIGAGIAALAYAIGVRGLFRGGEEALHVNPDRDRFLLQFGPPGTGEGSGFFVLAAALAEMGQTPLFDRLMRADTRREWDRVKREIAAVLAARGVTIGV